MYSYCIVREAKKPSFVRLDRRSNEELKTQTKYLCDVSGWNCLHTYNQIYVFMLILYMHILYWLV